MTESLQRENCQLLREKEQVVKQLQLLFGIYTRQKRVIQKLDATVSESESELKEREDKIKFLEENERVKLSQGQELEILKVRHKSEIDILRQKLKDLESKLLILEDEKHKLALSELELKDQLQKHSKKNVEAEHLANLAKSKLQHEINALSKHKEQLVQDNRSLESKLSLLSRENEKLVEETQRLHKEVNRLNFTNEELTDQLQRWRLKASKGSILKLGRIIETPRMQRLAEIERKLEAIIKHQRKNNEEELQKTEENAHKESAEEESNLEDMLRDLTAQIMDKDELQNPNVIRKFKLDQVKLEDRENEYKNLLRAMGALYFTNRYKAMLPFLFSHWRDLLYEKLEEEKKEVDNRVKGNTASVPGPLNKALEKEFDNDTQNEGFIEDNSEVESNERESVADSVEDNFATIVHTKKNQAQEVLVRDDWDDQQDCEEDLTEN
eukprot:TRINITY_DN4687_c0_g5_i1.p1 TRINITY_DN4687_c0_g5~~TRINITY_DN4687_c0_g5_i1.p1  ORF type:complete len:440 (+),score=121.39 TRINITY_DN4687_c0_g5_i1:260-1579(+)